MVNKFIYIVILVVVISVVFYWFLYGRTSVLKKSILVIRGQEFEIEIADTVYERAQGLSHRDSLPEHAGLLFKFSGLGSPGFWMKDMNFPIDILWFRGDELVSISKDAKPEPEKSLFQLKQYYPSEPIDTVLEINAGLSDKYGFMPGDRFILK